MRKDITTSRLSLDEMPDALTQILTDFQHASFDVRQDAVQAGAEVFKSAIEQSTPRDTGDMAQSWEIKTKYKNHRYIGNTKTAKGVVHRKTKDGKQGEAREGVPLANVLEYSEKSPHKGFIRRCFDGTEAQIFDAIKKTIQNGGKQ